MSGHYPQSSRLCRKFLPAPNRDVNVLFNPLVYMSEGLRAALTPELPHLPVGVVLGALILALSLAGLRGHPRIFAQSAELSSGSPAGKMPALPSRPGGGSPGCA